MTTPQFFYYYVLISLRSSQGSCDGRKRQNAERRGCCKLRDIFVYACILKQYQSEGEIFLNVLDGSINTYICAHTQKKSIHNCRFKFVEQLTYIKFKNVNTSKNQTAVIAMNFQTQFYHMTNALLYLQRVTHEKEYLPLYAKAFWNVEWIKNKRTESSLFHYLVTFRCHSTLFKSLKQARNKYQPYLDDKGTTQIAFQEENCILISATYLSTAVSAHAAWE